MEIKDINAANSVQALFSKAVAGAVSGQNLGAGFASLIGQTTDAVISVKGDLKPVENVIKEKVSTKSKEVEDRTFADEPKKDLKKQKKIKDNTENNVVAQGNIEQNNAKVNHPKEKQAIEGATVEGVKNDISEESPNIDFVADNGNVLDLAKKVLLEPVRELQSRDLGKSMVEAMVNSDVAAVVLSGGEVVLPQNMTLADLAEQPVLNVFDEVSGNVMQVFGEEFVAKVMQAANTENLFALNTVNEDFVAELQPLKLADYEERELSFGQDDVEMLTQPMLADVDDVLAEQAKILNEKITDKVEINVDVREEKNSYVADKTLIADKMILEEAILAAETEVVDGDQVVSTTNDTVKPSVVVSANNATLQNQAPVAAIAQGTSLASDASVVQSTSVEGVSSIANNQSNVLNGASLIAENKAENSIRAFETNNRDVYKGMSKEVVEQVKVNITKSAVKGVDKIDVRLKPEDLGNIEIKMQISKDGKLQAHITASRQETMEILRSEVQDLEKAFNDAGFETDDSSFTFSFQNGQNENEQDQNAKLRSFIGSALEQEQENAWAENDNSQVWDAAQGLNIKV